MTKSRARASQQALAVPAEPKVSALTGFDPSRVGFTGTQWGWTVEQANTATARLCALRRVGAVWLHNGDCVGSDRNAAHRWQMDGGKLHLHPPDRDTKRAFLVADVTEPPKPYLDRNSDIVARCGILVATPAEMFEQLRSGTWATVRRARKLGKPIFIIWPDGTETVENAIATEAQRATDSEAGVVREGADPQGIAQGQQP
jgi:hypothetical protein